MGTCSDVNIKEKNYKFKPIISKYKQNCLDSIKSNFILKELFSFLKEKKKLEMIIYNKYLQKKLGVDIENYKRISIKYKVGKRNGKGCEIY